MTAWLTPEWLAGAAAALGDLALPSGRSGAVRCTVAGGGPEGADAVSTVRWDAGRLASWTEGADGPADLSLGLSAADAWSVLVGEGSLAVAFMQGRCKVEGDTGLLLELLALAATPAAGAARDAVAAATDR